MLSYVTDVRTEIETHCVADGRFQVPNIWKMSSFAETRASDIVLIFLLDYILLKTKESWVGAVVLHFYQQERGKKSLMDDGTSWELERKKYVYMSPRA